ncbi:MAG: choice-of-anchor Q domain-containing protein [Kiritimatiellia bacterium]
MWKDGSGRATSGFSVGSDPYEILPGSPAVDNGLIKTGAGFTYVDVNYNGSYNAMVDIIVSGTPPSGNHLVFNTDIRGAQRFTQTSIDMGAYEYQPPKGSVFIVR